MGNDTPQANPKIYSQAQRMALSLTHTEAVLLLKVLSAARLGPLEGLYSDMKQMAKRRGWLAGAEGITSLS